MNSRRKTNETTEKSAGQRKGPIGQPIAHNRPSGGQTSKLKPNDAAGQPQSRGASQPDLGNMNQRRKKWPDHDKITMRNLAIENATAMSQRKTLISWGEAHPGETEMAGQGHNDHIAAHK